MLPSVHVPEFINEVSFAFVASIWCGLLYSAENWYGLIRIPYEVLPRGACNANAIHINSLDQLITQLMTASCRINTNGQLLDQLEIEYHTHTRERERERLNLVLPKKRNHIDFSRY